METEFKKVKDIQTSYYNPRVALKPGDPEWENLKNSIDNYGYIVPVVINKRTQHLVSGHQRLSVLMEQNPEQEILVIEIDIDETKEKQLNISMNRIEGTWDYEKLSNLFLEYDFTEISHTGFTETELCSLYPDTYKLREGEPAGEKAEQEETTEIDPVVNETEEEQESPFHIFLSFGSQQEADEWLSNQGIRKEWKGGNSIILKMEGCGYGD